MSFKTLSILGTLYLACFSGLLFSQNLPPDFYREQVAEFPLGTGINFDASGRMFAWTKAGQVFIFEEGQAQPTLLLDLSEEVANWGDHGLMWVEPHPNFLQNGFLYLLYVVDRHHLLFHGTPQYDPTANINQPPTIGRVTRFTADVAQDFKSIISGSRKVILGKTIDDGLPLVHFSHSVGMLNFAEDGSMLLSCGDGGSYIRADVGGGSAEGAGPQAVGEGIMEAKEDVGAFRSQLVDSHSGKVLRIDPETGEGLPSNPFFDPTEPAAARSRVYALGFRSPFRFSIFPGTGDHDQAAGNPGVLLVGDVGWSYWEEVNTVTQGGQNFGWPLYEGLKDRWQYFWEPVKNLDAPNPVNIPGCDRNHFWFKDLIKQDARQSPKFPNPCDTFLTIPSDIPTFVHRRPAITWSNSEWNNEEQGTFVPGYGPGGEAIRISMDDPAGPTGDEFHGFCVIGGVVYSGTTYPVKYQMTYFFADYQGWIRKMDFGPNYEVLSVEPFMEGGKDIVCLTENPKDGLIYFVEYGPTSKVYRINYGGNPRPVANIQADTFYGPSPLTVKFNGEGSFDPEGEPIDFFWDFGDGTTSTAINPTHTFSAPGSDPVAFTVTLTVSDSLGASDSVKALISPNNSPPDVRITSLEDGDYYSITGATLQPLEAEVVDKEHPDHQLKYEWQTFFHHNAHYHPEPVDTNRITTTVLTPDGCEEEDYWFRIRLTVSDPTGLKTQREVEVFPFCGDAYTEFDTVMAESNDKTVVVQWQTLSESPGTYFEIQRGLDKYHFETIGETDLNGPGIPYSFEDQNAPQGQILYRIKTVMPNTFYDYSPVAEAVFPEPPLVKVYPTPAEKKVFVWFREIKEKASAEILDLTGKSLASYSWTDPVKETEQELPVGKLAPGIYLLRLVVDQQESLKKIIVQ